MRKCVQSKRDNFNKSEKLYIYLYPFNVYLPYSMALRFRQVAILCLHVSRWTPLDTGAKPGVSFSLDLYPFERLRRRLKVRLFRFFFQFLCCTWEQPSWAETGRAHDEWGTLGLPSRLGTQGTRNEDDTAQEFVAFILYILFYLFIYFIFVFIYLFSCSLCGWCAVLYHSYVHSRLQLMFELLWQGRGETHVDTSR